MIARVPFTGDTDFEVMQAHMQNPPPLPTRFYPYIPKGVENAVLQSMAKSPDQPTYSHGTVVTLNGKPGEDTPVGTFLVRLADLSQWKVQTKDLYFINKVIDQRKEQTIVLFNDNSFCFI